MDTPFYQTVVDRLKSHKALRQLGFDAEADIRWYGKGADRSDLLQVARHDQWMIQASDATDLGYHGVWVHYESCRPGHWCIHCELYPRLSKAAKEQVGDHADLLELKKVITEELRAFGEQYDWPGRFGAHLKRATRDPTDPSSLIVWTFDLGLDKDCTPAAFVEAVVPIITGTVNTIDEFLVPLAQPGS